MAPEKGKSENNLTLAEIRSALDDVERQRAREGITVEERLALEDASMTLRAAERAAVTDLQKLSEQSKALWNAIEKLKNVG